jgi:hypothetical protein
VRIILGRNFIEYARLVTFGAHLVKMGPHILYELQVSEPSSPFVPDLKVLDANGPEKVAGGLCQADELDDEIDLSSPDVTPKDQLIFQCKQHQRKCRYLRV